MIFDVCFIDYVDVVFIVKFVLVWIVYVVGVLNCVQVKLFVYFGVLFYLFVCNGCVVEGISFVLVCIEKFDGLVVNFEDFIFLFDFVDFDFG